MRSALPLAVFILIAGLLAYGLQLDPKLVPSPLIGKPAPEFSLPRLDAPEEYLGLKDFKGKAWVINVWASWCVACLAEHEFITELAEMKIAPVVGLNYKDDPSDARHWLEQNGDSYSASIMDRDGRVAIDWGVYGVPETFIIDKNGTITYKHIGPITRESLEAEVIPSLREAAG